MISIDDLYDEFTRNVVELLNSKDRGHNVFFGTPVIDDIAGQMLLRFRDAMGNFWDNLEYMKIILQKLTKLILK